MGQDNLLDSYLPTQLDKVKKLKKGKLVGHLACSWRGPLPLMIPESQTLQTHRAAMSSGWGAQTSPEDIEHSLHQPE